MKKYLNLKWKGETPTRICTSYGSEKFDIQPGGILPVEELQAQSLCRFDKRFEIVGVAEPEIQEEEKTEKKKAKK